MFDPLLLFALAFTAVAFYTIGAVRSVQEAVEDLDVVLLYTFAACLGLAWAWLGYIYTHVARAVGVSLIFFVVVGCGPSYQGVTREQSETFSEAADLAEDCYLAQEGHYRRLPDDLEAVTVYPGTECRLEAVACARADEGRIYLVEGEYQRAAVPVVAHELVHVLLHEDWPNDGDAHHHWLDVATKAHPERCGTIPVRSIEEVTP